MAPPPVAVAICDRGDCPAPTQRTLMVHGQDFHFCGHHAVEVTHALGTLDTATTSRAIMKTSDAARPALIGREPKPAVETLQEVRRDV